MSRRRRKQNRFKRLIKKLTSLIFKLFITLIGYLACILMCGYAVIIRRKNRYRNLY